jgi:formate hydrogenlyase subunit 3/multisubunit Na+/H+ antiporter MnhD subunit
MDDRVIGVLIIVSSLVVMTGYFLWAFGDQLLPEVITPEVSEWAFRVPVVIAVYAVLLILLWIGYTMATTPPPIPLEKPLEIEREEEEERA